MKIILHYLEKLEAQRILWLMEELKAPYEAIYYRRDRMGNPPLELAQIHPLGESPVIEVHHHQDHHKVIAGSSHIIRFLLQNFDTGKRLVYPANPHYAEEMDYLLHYLEATLQPLQDWLSTKSRVVQNTPFGLQGVAKWAAGALGGTTYAQELIRNLQYLDDVLKTQEERGHAYLVGTKFSLADIMVGYPILQGFCYSPEIYYDLNGGNFDAGKCFPHLYKWCKLCQKQELLQRANEIVVDLNNASLGQKLAQV